MMATPWEDEEEEVEEEVEEVEEEVGSCMGETIMKRAVRLSGDR